MLVVDNNNNKYYDNNINAKYVPKEKLLFNYPRKSSSQEKMIDKKID